jgi:hypothetical protein
MKSLKIIENEIIRLTTLIEIEYPELYIFLDENPSTIPSKNHPNITIQIMQDYLDSLKQLLSHHVETHKNK